MSRDYGSWMSKLSQFLRLNQVAIPGAHDAGSWQMNKRSELCEHRQDLDPIGKICKCVTANYAKVQNLSLLEQAEAGVRYFDLRVCNHDGEYLFEHGMVEGNFLEGVSELQHFALTHPREILILDIRFTRGFTEIDHKFLTNNLANLFKDLIVSRELGPRSELREFWESDVNVVIIYHGYEDERFWVGGSISTSWPNTYDVSVAVAKIINYLENRTDDNSRLSSYQSTLTPDGGYIARHLFSGTQKLAKKINDRIPEILSEYRLSHKVGIITVDVVEHPNLIESIIVSNF